MPPPNEGSDQAETSRNRSLNTLDHKKEEKQKNTLDYKRSEEHSGQGIKNNNNKQA